MKHTLAITKSTVKKWILSCETQVQLEIAEETVDQFISKQRFADVSHTDIFNAMHELDDTIKLMQKVLMLKDKGDQEAAKELYTKIAM